MPEFGFPAQPRQAQLARIISDLRNRADDERVAAVTGRYADVTAAREGRVNELMQIEKSITDLNGYAEAIALSEARADTMQQSLDRLSDIGQVLTDTTDLLTTNGTDANFEVVSAQARADLDVLVAALNVDFAGRALFAGDDAGTSSLIDPATMFTTSVAVLEAAPNSAIAYADLQNEFLNAGATFETTFYQGGTGRAPLTEVAPGETVDYTVKADEAAIRKVLFNTVVLAAAHDPTNAIPAAERRSLMEKGSAGMRSAISELTTIQARLGTAEARIATVKARNIAMEAAFTVQFNDLAGADDYAAALALTELDTQLETAFATTARLSNLSLVNYL